MRLIRISQSLLLASLIITGSISVPGIAQDSPQKTFMESFQKLIAEKDVDGAIKLVDETSDVQPEFLAQYRMQLGATLLREKRNDDAASQFEKALEAAFAKLEDGSNPRSVGVIFPNATMMLRQIQPAKADQWIEKCLTTLEAKLSSDRLSDLHGTYAQLMRTKLNTPNKEAAEQAKNKLLEFVGKCEKLYANQSDPKANAKTMIDLWNDLLVVSDEKESQPLFEKLQALAQSQLKDSPSVPVFASYTMAVSSFVSRNARTAPDLAGDTLNSAMAFIESVESDDVNFNRIRENFAKNAERMSKSIESARALVKMIGQPAPAIDPMEWVNGEPETLESLKGKVVLLDFWAVWCGPCIATFPHLKHLDAEYGPKGLTIIGVTRQYNFSWDEATSNASRSKDPVSLEDEMAMLEKFIAKHELTHRTMLTPENSKMQSEYLVTGIPHVALLDKKGMVRLVKIGSGSKNAEEIEAMVKTLLEE
jgi:thiol-disulfide isomerase/thioredoxin